MTYQCLRTDVTLQTSARGKIFLIKHFIRKIDVRIFKSVQVFQQSTCMIGMTMRDKSPIGTRQINTHLLGIIQEHPASSHIAKNSVSFRFYIKGQAMLRLQHQIITRGIINQNLYDHSILKLSNNIKFQSKKISQAFPPTRFFF